MIDAPKSGRSSETNRLLFISGHSVRNQHADRTAARPSHFRTDILPFRRGRDLLVGLMIVVPIYVQRTGAWKAGLAIPLRVG